MCRVTAGGVQDMRENLNAYEKIADLIESDELSIGEIADKLTALQWVMEGNGEEKTKAYRRVSSLIDRFDALR